MGQLRAARLAGAVGRRRAARGHRSARPVLQRRDHRDEALSTPTPDTVLFDLDGTLSDSEPGILAALRTSFAENGIAPLEPTVERTLLGPPFYDSLPPHIGGTAKLDAVIDRYRFHYRAGAMFDTVAYDGIADVLATLHGAGLRLAVATSKPEPQAVPIVEHLGLAGYFTTVVGDDLVGTRRTKALVIAEAIERLGGVDPDRTVMVGDREHDVFGAREHGIQCIGAGWGYGAPDELAAAGAHLVLAAPAELTAALGITGHGSAAAS